MRTTLRPTVLLLAAALLVAACGGGDDSAPTDPVAAAEPETAVDGTDVPVTSDRADRADEASTTTEPTEAATAPTTDVAAETETEEPPVASVRAPEISDIQIETYLDQATRSTLGGQNTYYWPDGTMGSVTLPDGRTRFFAANSSRTARTIGTPLDPAGGVEDASQAIGGATAEFAYLAGGPVYLDPASEMLLLWYHAERHFGGDGSTFHGAVGLARSFDYGETFEDLGIIIETNSTPDPDAPCCADVGGAPMIVRDGIFHVYYRDRVGTTLPTDIQLARASAPVDDVLRAALDGTTSPWTKYDAGDEEPGLGGRASALESGNPRTSWFDVAWHEGMQRYLLIIAVHGFLDEPSQLYLTSSADGITWTPRQLLTACDCELTYPSILGTEGPTRGERLVGDELSIIYVSTASTAAFRWEQTTVERMTLTLSGQLVTGPTAWSFDDEGPDTSGWVAGGDATATSVDGSLVITGTAPDPYVTSPPLGLSTDEFASVRIVMSSEASGRGQVFFTTDDAPGIDERRSVRFDVTGDGATAEYTIDLAEVDGWDGILDTIRIDPVDQPGVVRIDEIELVAA